MTDLQEDEERSLRSILGTHAHDRWGVWTDAHLWLQVNHLTPVHKMNW